METTCINSLKEHYVRLKITLSLILEVEDSAR